MSDELTDRQKLRASMTDEEWATMKASEPGGGGGPNSKYFGGAKKPDFHLFGTDLFGDEIKADAKGALREKFEFPPFSVLNAREGAWQARKRAWLSVGIQSELGRGATPESRPNDSNLLPEGQKGLSAGLANNAGRPAKELIGNGMGMTSKKRYDASPGGSLDAMRHREDTKLRSNTSSSSSNAMQYAGGFEDTGAGSSGTSIFDPVLTELSYRWFCPEGGLVLDPFAGGSVRGLVAGLLGFQYHGIDLRAEQIAANERQRADIAPEAAIVWACGDSNKILPEAPFADMAFSCPPYADLEQYSDDPDDLSTMSWEKFSELYRSIIHKTVDRMKPNTFAVFVVGEVRDKKTGFYRGLIPLTCECFTTAGAHFYNSAILVTAVGSLPIRITKQFEAGRKLGTTHQHVLCFVKGDPKLACEAIRRAAAGEAMPAAAPNKPVASRPAAPRPPQAAPQGASSAPAGPRPSALDFVRSRPAAASTPEPEPRTEDVHGTQGAAPVVGHRLGHEGPVEPLDAAGVQHAVEGHAAPDDVGPLSHAADLPSALAFVVKKDPLKAADEPREDAARKQTTEPLTPDLSPAEVKLRLEIRGHRLMKLDDFFFITEPERLTPEEGEAIKVIGRRLLDVADEWDGKEFFEARTEALPAVDVVTSVDAGASPVDPRGGGSDVSLGQGEESSGALAQETPSTVGDGAGVEVARPAVHAPESAAPSPTIEFHDLTVSEALAAASNVVGGSFFDEPAAGQSMAQFLGSEPPRIDASYRPDEPPDLAGIDEIVLNFATDGVDWARGHRPGGVTVSSMDGSLCRFLPFRFASGNLDEATVKRWAQEQLRNKRIVNSRTKFDVHMSRAWGVDLEAQGCTFSDVGHTAGLLDNTRKRVGLDYLAADWLPDLPKSHRVDETQHLNYHAAEAAERERFTASLVWRLRQAMWPKVVAEGLEEVHALEDSVIPAVVEMERNGAPIDLELMERCGQEVKAEHDKLMIAVSKEAGFAFEHTASGWKRLLEGLKLKVPDSFNEASLNQVDHPLVRKGQQASQLASLNSKIFKAYPEHVVDGILRYDINQMASEDGGTSTGRFSIGLVQQVPNAENHEAAFGDRWFPRSLFIPGAGQVGEADAEQIEFRLLVHYSQNKKLLEAYRKDPRMSFHKEMWAMLKAYKPDMLYVHTKSYNFASAYGAKSIKLATMMGFITEREGAEIRAAKLWDDPRLALIKGIEAAYAQAHPEAKALLEKAAHLAKPACDDYCKRGDRWHRELPHRGWVKTMDGRRSHFTEGSKHYIALNHIIQGSGASIMKRKLKELHDARKATQFVMRITNHDAVVGDALEPDTMAKVGAILDAQSYPLSVPILWACKQGPSWAECK